MNCHYLSVFDMIMYSVYGRAIWWQLWTQVCMWKKYGIMWSSNRTVPLPTWLLRCTVQTEWVLVSRIFTA